jgi:hypothetical protein
MRIIPKNNKILTGVKKNSIKYQMNGNLFKGQIKCQRSVRLKNHFLSAVSIRPYFFSKYIAKNLKRYLYISL